MSKLLNFDRFMAEKNRETIDILIYGETVTIRSAIPAVVPVTMARAEESGDNAERVRMVMRAADAMFGKENVDRWCARGISAEELGALVTKAFALVNGGEDEEEDDSVELDDESGKTAPRKPEKNG